MKKKSNKSPLLGKFFVRLIIKPGDFDYAFGDIIEIYNDIAEEKGKICALFWFWVHIIISVPRCIKNKVYWRSVMFKNYLKISIRNILKHKWYSFINIFGLSIGIASCLMISLWIFNELNYDRFHKDVSNIYQVLGSGLTKNFPSTPVPLAPVLEEEYPEIISATRFEDGGEVLLSYKNSKFYEKGIAAVDPSFFKIFSFPIVKGDRDTILKEPNSIVISEKIAEKYFSDIDPIEKVLTINNKSDFIVTGVVKDVPLNSSLQFDMVVPFNIDILYSGKLDWDQIGPRTFLKVQANCSTEDINNKIMNTIPEHKKGLDITLSVLPLKERYFFFSGTKKYIYIFSVIAFFILVIACFNFINLSTARSMNRATEICIRKVTGAYRKDIIIQFLGESLVLSFIALFFSLLLINLFLRVFNSLTGIDLMVNNQYIFPVLLGLIIFTGIAAGSYPALLISNFHPIAILKNCLKSGSKGFILRKILVVIQFSISIVLIIATGIVYKQLNYIKNKDIGYDKDQIVKISMKGDSRKYYNVLKNRLLQDRRILGVTGTADELPYFSSQTGGAKWEGKNPNKHILTTFNYVDYDFIKTLKIKMVEGRSFSREFSTDKELCFLVNEEMVKKMALKSGLGAKLIFFDKPGKIIGVMKNFNFQPLNSKIDPLVLMLSNKIVYFVLIRIQPENISSTLTYINETWRKILPMYPFLYSFLDKDFDRRYRKIKRMGILSNWFSLLAVFIACLGLFGLASFTAEQRTKDIGIRKVLGASVSHIVFLLSKEFIRCVLIANIIAWPVAYIALNRWLQDFAFHTNIGPGTFFLSGLLALIIALLSVSFQSIKAARAKPVDSLKYE